MHRMQTLILVLLVAVAPAGAVVLINEVDCDQPGTDAVEFVELYNSGSAAVDLTAGGYVLVLYNGNGDTSYRSADLVGTLAAGGFYVIGAATVESVDLTPDGWPATNIIENGADAVALYSGTSAAMFTRGAPVTAANLVDAVVYDTDDPDDAGLLDVLTPGQPQVNERMGGDALLHSIQRVPDGAGGPRVTTAYRAQEPTSGRSNSQEPDTDSDGVPDAGEGENEGLGAGQSNRILPDSDGDGLLDGQEDRNANGSRDAGETSTRNRDSDGDNYEDGIEVLLGMNPLLADGGYADADKDGLPDSADLFPGRDQDDDRFDDGYDAASFQSLASANNAADVPNTGDVNGDAAVSNLDALVINSYFLGSIDETAPVYSPGEYAGFRFMDSSRDGVASNLDALIAQSFFLDNLAFLPLR